jgi:PAP2 superfamily
MARMVQNRFSVGVYVPNLMLSWQQAALLAIGLGTAAILLAAAGHAAGRDRRASRAARWAARTGPFAREAGIVVALYALWQLAGNLSSGGYRGAIAHAWWVWHAERTLRLPSEPAVQRLLLPHPLLSQAANLYYATMHFGMLIVMLVWLFARHRDGYPGVRNAVAASTAICLLISLVPVAPPRMLTSLGFVDLAARYGQSVYVALGSTAGADQLSAMPSVHVAWAVLVAWAVVTRGTSRCRWLILLHPAVTVFVVVATGNHFWADGIVAASVVALVLAAQALVTRRAVVHRSLALPALRQRQYEPQGDDHAGQHPGDQARGNRADDETRDEQHCDQHGAGHRG